MTLVCANRQCELPLATADARIEIKAKIPSGWFNVQQTTFVKWKRNGEAVFHVDCWKYVLKIAKSRKKSSIDGMPVAMKQSERLMIAKAAATRETFDSEEDVKKAAKKTAELILNSRHCIAFTGAGVSTSAGLGDFRGKSGKWTEEDQSSVDRVIREAFQEDVAASAKSKLPSTSGGHSLPQEKIRTSRNDIRNSESSRHIEKYCETHKGPAASSSVKSTLTDRLQLSEPRTLRSNTSSPKLPPKSTRSTPDLSAPPSTSELNQTFTEQEMSLSGFYSEMLRPSFSIGTEDIDCNDESGCESNYLSKHLDHHINCNNPAVSEGQDAADDSADSTADQEEEAVDYENLRPTYTHETLKLMVDRGLLCYVISQNCDGLHLLSGLPADRLSELHGNVFVERCSTCNRRYERNFYVLNDEASQFYEELEDEGETTVIKPKFARRCTLCGLCHRTGRRCEETECNGFLVDTIINFRDNLEESVLDRAMYEAGLSNVILCLGTTLMVTPASEIVEEAIGRKPLIICNRQKTSKDHLAKVRVFGDCDLFMREVLRHIIGEEWREWEEQREERRRSYDSKRTLQAPGIKRRHSTAVDTTVKKRPPRSSKKGE